MDAADRNLFQIYQSERPDLNKVRMLMRETMECVQHLHEKRLVHGDIKMLNVVRLALDNRLRLIDLDAAARKLAAMAETTCARSSRPRFYPPECFAKLDAGSTTQFKSYFEGVDAELREKVAPKVDKRGASYVVKTFSLTREGDPENRRPAVRAREGVWLKPSTTGRSGALLFQLVAGEPLVPSNRDDDCVNAEYGHIGDLERRRCKKEFSCNQGRGAWDLASKLLVRDPERASQV